MCSIASNLRNAASSLSTASWRVSSERQIQIEIRGTQQVAVEPYGRVFLRRLRVHFFATTDGSCPLKQRRLSIPGTLTILGRCGSDPFQQSFKPRYRYSFGCFADFTSSKLSLSKQYFEVFLPEPVELEVTQDASGARTASFSFIFSFIPRCGTVLLHGQLSPPVVDESRGIITLTTGFSSRLLINIPRSRRRRLIEAARTLILFARNAGVFRGTIYEEASICIPQQLNRSTSLSFKDDDLDDPDCSSEDGSSASESASGSDLSDISSSDSISDSSISSS